MHHKFDLDERLIEFASNCLDVSEGLPKTFAANHIAGQLIRCSSPPAIHYGEAQAPESTGDFVHKMKVCLKELRETFNCLKLISKKGWYDQSIIDRLLGENNELISIFVASIKTASSKKDPNCKKQSP